MIEPLNRALFDEQLDDASTLTVLLKGHLWIEHVIDQAVDVSLTDSSQLNIERMSYAAKLDLALASGALPLELGPPLKRINRLRNDAAHNLSFELTDRMMRGLLDTITHPELRQVLKRIDTGGYSLAVQLRHWVHAVVFAVAWQNTLTDYERTNKQALEKYRLIKALGERLGDERPDDELRERYGVPPSPEPMSVWTPAADGRGNATRTASEAE